MSKSAITAEQQLTTGLAVRSKPWLDSDCITAAASGDAVASQRRHGRDNAAERRTILSADRVYRYVLWREWDILNASYLMVIGLNPSTADETKDDPTIRKCVGFAKRWGFGALCMTNLFAFRATDPRMMKKAVNPEGPENDKWLRELASGAARIIAAWGKHGNHRAGSSHLFTVLDLPERQTRVECLRTNKDGSPEHPLYVPYETEPRLYLSRYGSEVAGLAATVTRDVRGSRNTTAQESNASNSAAAKP